MVGHALIIVFVVILAGAEISVFVLALVDMIRTPKARFVAAGRSKGAWLGGLIALLLINVVGLVFGLYYLIKVRPELKNASPQN